MSTPSEINRPAEIEYRRKSFREIWLPLIITLSILGGLGIFAIVLMVNQDTSVNATKWSHISALYLTSLLCLCNLIPLSILGGLVYLMRKAPDGVINLGHSMQDTTQKISNGARNLGDKLAEPVVSASSKAASFSRLFRRRNKPDA